MTTTLPDIERALRLLCLSGIRDTLETRVLQAQGSQQPFLETFALILQDELDRSQSRLIARRYQQSGLEEKLTVTEFDWSTPANRTSRRPTPVRPFSRGTKFSISRPTTSSTVTRSVRPSSGRPGCAPFSIATCLCLTTCFSRVPFPTPPAHYCRTSSISATSCVEAFSSLPIGSCRTGAPTLAITR